MNKLSSEFKGDDTGEKLFDRTTSPACTFQDFEVFEKCVVIEDKKFYSVPHLKELFSIMYVEGQGERENIKFVGLVFREKLYGFVYIEGYDTVEIVSGSFREETILSGVRKSYKIRLTYIDTIDGIEGDVSDILKQYWGIEID